MSDDFEHFTTSLTAPLTDGSAVAPSDSNDLPKVTRALFVGQPGDVTLILHSGQTVTLGGLQAGALYPLRVRRVLATGTSADNIVGLW